MKEEINNELKVSEESTSPIINTSEGSEQIIIETPSGFKINLSSAFIRCDGLVSLSLSLLDELYKKHSNKKTNEGNYLW